MSSPFTVNIHLKIPPHTGKPHNDKESTANPTTTPLFTPTTTQKDGDLLLAKGIFNKNGTIDLEKIRSDLSETLNQKKPQIEHTEKKSQQDMGFTINHPPELVKLEQIKDFNSRVSSQIDKLKSMLDENAIEIFQLLLTIEQLSPANIDKTIVLGDADGSISRQVLGGIISGAITLDEDGIKILAELITAETKTLSILNENSLLEEVASKESNGVKEDFQRLEQVFFSPRSRLSNNTERKAAFDAAEQHISFITDEQGRIDFLIFYRDHLGILRKLTEMPEPNIEKSRLYLKLEYAITAWVLRSFQSNEKNQTNVENLFKHMCFHPLIRKVVNLGDCCFDRLTCNLHMEVLIREVLKACGVVFIYGNHDVPAIREKIISDKSHNIMALSQFACNARNSHVNLAILQNHVKYVFNNVFLDQTSGILFIHHHPLLRVENGTVYMTALLKRIVLSGKGDGAALAAEINSLPKFELASEANDFTRQRLAEDTPETDDTAKNLIIAALKRLGINKILHGHEKIFLSSSLNGITVSFNSEGQQIHYFAAAGLV